MIGGLTSFIRLIFFVITLFSLFVLVTVFVQCYAAWPLCKHIKHWIFTQYFLSYGGSYLLISPTLLANDVTSELVCWITMELVYLSRRIRVTCMFLGYQLSPILKLFWEYTYNFLCWFPLYLRKIYERYLSLISFINSIFSSELGS